MKDSKNLVIGMLCAVICIMAVAYAAFSTTLTINGTATIDSKWEVKITNIQCEATEVAGGVDATVEADTIGDEGSTSAQFDMTFHQPGDTATCTVTITNSGTLNAKVNAINVGYKDKTGAAATLDSDAIIYEVSGIEKDTKLPATTNNTNTYTVTATYDPDITTQPAEKALEKTLTVTIEYVQDLANAGA